MSKIYDVDLSSFVGRLGSLYGKYRLCPPFLLREAAERWIARGIPLSHCVGVIERYLSRHASTFSCGSGDRDFTWLSNLIQTTWSERSFAMAHPAAEQTWPRNPIRGYGAVEQSLEAGHRTPQIKYPPNPSAARPDAVALLKATLARLASADHVISSGSSQPRPCSNVRVSGPKKIDTAVAWLCSELATGEQAASVVEAKAQSVGIASRTYDRARKRLGVTSRRVGFGRWAKYVIALPEVHATPPAASTGAALHEGIEGKRERRKAPGLCENGRYW